MIPILNFLVLKKKQIQPYPTGHSGIRSERAFFPQLGIPELGNLELGILDLGFPELSSIGVLKCSFTFFWFPMLAIPRFGVPIHLVLLI